jgi:uncharacterized iron-regulated membrane protein
MPRMRPLLRKWGAIGHLWVGLTSGLLFVLLGLTGSLIVFRPQIEAASIAFAEDECASSAASLDIAVEAIRGFRPNGVVQRLYFPPGKRFTYILEVNQPGARSSRISYDACQNRVLGSVPTVWLDWIVDLHHDLLSGKAGRQIVGLGGIGLLLTLGSGLLIWLVSGAPFRNLLRIQTQQSLRRFAFDLHRCAGVLALLFLEFKLLPAWRFRIHRQCAHSWASTRQAEGTTNHSPIMA